MHFAVFIILVTLDMWGSGSATILYSIMTKKFCPVVWKLTSAANFGY